MIEYCTCKYTKGYCSLYDKYNTFVCGNCLKPSYFVWLGSERLCEECGGSFWSRWEVICLDCTGALVALAAQVRADGASALDIGLILTSVNPEGYRSWTTMRETLRTDPYHHRVIFRDYPDPHSPDCSCKACVYWDSRDPERSPKRAGPWVATGSVPCDSCKKPIREHSADEGKECHGRMVLVREMQKGSR